MSRGLRPGCRPIRAPGPVAGNDAGVDGDAGMFSDTGMVTAEVAVALPALVLAALLAVTGIEVASAQLRCLDAAAIAARLAARGELAADVESAATAAAPRDARIRVSHEGDLVSAVVVVSVHPLGLGGLLPGFTVTATAAEPAEPGDGGPKQGGS